MPTMSCKCRVPVTLILLLVYFCYLLVGAAVFWVLESKAEVDQSLIFKQEKWELLKNHTCMDNDTLEQFIKGIIAAYKNGVSIQENDTSLETWSFAGSFFFSVTAITTIGYGNISPATVGGRIFCIFFALFGIPLNLILLNRIGQRMLSAVHKCANLLEEKIHQQTAKILAYFFALVMGLLLFFLLPPILFKGIEGWTYEEGFYYAFITLSTIGFGDYVIGRVPDKQYPGWYRNVVSVWILLGMAWLALVINLCISLLESYSEVIHCCRKKENKVMDSELMDIVHGGSMPTAPKEKADIKDTLAALKEKEDMKDALPMLKEKEEVRDTAAIKEKEYMLSVIDTKLESPD
ncbi:potassium channel subfamily K member 17 [Pelobates cultripes]|uniref:Potassium channel subfamily K member 17 n=1 Tax=Pelobates cultripes TaxID=61616 RepID=A0AAD1RKJ1_PELCU|nr:potassium channel subfamily K member 17 [Pelobates cultripes]